MRIIPKTSKVKFTVYKSITVVDLIIGFTALALLAITLSSNLPYRFYIAIGIVVIIVPLFISFNGDRLYEYIGFIFKFIVNRKSYKRDSANNQADVSGIISYGTIENNLIINKDSSFVGVIEINPIDFKLLSPDRQDDYIDGVFSRIINNVNHTDRLMVVKLERPLILDGNIKDELKRLDEIVKAYENGILTEKEYRSRVDLIQDRITLIDKINSGEEIFYSRYYLCLVSKGKNELNNTIDRSVSILNSGGIPSHRLDEKELVAFVRYSIDANFDERTLDDITEYSDLLSPKDVSFRLNSTRQDGMQLSHFVINNYPLKVGNAWGEGLFDMEHTKVVMKLIPVEKHKAVKRIDTSIMELQTQAIHNKASQQIDRETHLDTLEDLLVGIQTDNETLFDTTIIITVYDEPGKAVNRKKVRTRLREMGFGFSEMFGRQNDAYISSNIADIDRTKISRGIQTSSIAGCFPFVSNALIDKDGLLIGENKLPVFVDFFKRDSEHVNSNMVIIGKSGSGKSYATKTVLSGLASSNTKIYVLDPENEYGTLAENLDGTSLDVASGSYGKINPFHIIESIEDEDNQNSYFAHLQFLEQFYKLILPGINMDSLELLNKLTQEMYEKKGINSKTVLSKLKATDYPIFEDLCDFIDEKLEKESDEYNKQCLKVLVNYVSKFRKGGRNSNLWNGYTSFSPKENFLAFNFQKLLANKNDVTANAQMLLVLKWLENEVIKNRDYNLRYKTERKIVVVIDEAHVFIDEKYPIALDFMYQLAKRIRKYQGMLVIITQNVKDFTGTPEIARKSMAIINVSQYSLIFSLSPNDMTDLCKLYENAGEINDSEKDNIVHNPRGRAFLISSPSSRTNIDIIATAQTQKLFN